MIDLLTRGGIFSIGQQNSFWDTWRLGLFTYLFVVFCTMTLVLGSDCQCVMSRPSENFKLVGDLEILQQGHS